MYFLGLDLSPSHSVFSWNLIGTPFTKILIMIKWLSRSDRIVGRPLTFYMADTGLIPASHMIGYLWAATAVPVCRAKGKPWAPLGVTKIKE